MTFSVKIQHESLLKLAEAETEALTQKEADLAENRNEHKASQKPKASKDSLKVKKNNKKKQEL